MRGAIAIPSALLLPAIVLAQSPPLPTAPMISDPSTLTAVYQQLMGQWFAALSPIALDVFSALAALEIAVFGWNLWMTYNGDIRTAMMATANKVLILGFFLALLMNAGAWIGDIIDLFTVAGKTASGIDGLGPSTILLQGFKIFGTLLGQALKSGLLVDFPTAIALIIGALVICGAFLTITVQFILTKVQTFLVLGMGVLFLGFGGSRWTVPYVERYFAFGVASGVKLMVLYLLAGGGWAITNSWIATAQSPASSLAAVESEWIVACGAIIYALICWHGSSIAAAILGGSPNLTHSDFIAFAAPMISAGVSAGLIAAGVATGGTTAVAGAAGGAVAVGSAAGSAAGSAGGGGSNPSGGAPPQPSPNGNGSGGSLVSAAGQMAQVGANAVSRMPHGGGAASTPHFNGFGH